MTSFAFVIGIFFCLYFVSYQCEGKVHPPPGGRRLTFAAGTTAKIKWSYNGDIYYGVTFRNWYFTSSEGTPTELIVRLTLDNDPKIMNSSLPVVAVEKPATLVLRNVDSSYNGIYQFYLSAAGGRGSSDVAVFIAVSPNVTVNCSSPITMNKGDDVTCVCKGEGGNPPADVVWHSKDGVQIGGTGKEEQILILSNVDKTDSGTYTCVAQSHDLAKNETSIEVIVNYAPEEPYFKEKAVVGESFTIECETNGRPEPSYTIIHNDTEVVSTDKTYTIDVVNKIHAGLYKCIAENKLGKCSKKYNLSILDKLIIPTTGTTNTNFSTSENSGKVNTAANKEDDGATVIGWHIVVSLVSGFIMGSLFTHIVACCRRRFSHRKHQSNPEPQAPKDSSIYQDLDLTKMNSEDNYQSLRVIPANNEPENADLNIGATNDENNYQNLT